MSSLPAVATKERTTELEIELPENSSFPRRWIGLLVAAFAAFLLLVLAFSGFGHSAGIPVSDELRDTVRSDTGNIVCHATVYRC